MTTVGPLFPQGAAIGAIWLAQPYYDGLDPKIQPSRSLPKGGGHDYEYTSVQYYGGENGNRRFYGFHARVAAVQAGTGMSRIELWHPGTGNVAPTPAGSWWIDLKANTDGSRSAITTGSAAGATGSLYVDAATVGSIALFEPKIPPYKGGFAFPVFHRQP